MAILGLLLALATGAFTAGVLVSSTDASSLSVFGAHTTTNITTAGVFLVGALTGLVFAIGLSLLFSGLARRRTRRAELRSRETERRTQAETLRERNRELERKLEAERAARANGSPVSPYPAEPATADAPANRF